MSYAINYPTPQGANVQIFQAPARTAATFWSASWVKPQGASFVWFTVIGAGGSTDELSTNLVGGGSGAVTNCMVPAFLVPDVLQVRVGKGGANGATGGESTVFYQQKNTAGTVLILSSGGQPGSGGGNGGAASTSNYFSAMGFFQSVAGQGGVNGNQSASATTFLSGGSYSGTVTANYGYSTSENGFFQTRPIIIGTGAGSNGTVSGGIGCGGGSISASATRGVGGDGLVVIVTW